MHRPPQLSCSKPIVGMRAWTAALADDGSGCAYDCWAPRIVTDEGAALVDDRTAKQNGLAVTVGVSKADYVERIAQAGCVGILAGVTQPLVHPLGGTERLLGTNPLAIDPRWPGHATGALRPARSHLARFCKQKPGCMVHIRAMAWDSDCKALGERSIRQRRT